MTLDRHQLKVLGAHLRAGGSADTATLPPPAPKKKRNNEEWRIQADFFNWWRSESPAMKIWPGCMWHIPNGSMLGDNKKARQIRSRMLTLSGMWSGVVDTFLMYPMSRGNGLMWHGCFVEFKKPGVRTHKNGGLSDEQVEFTAQALAHGYQCRVAYSWQEGRDAVLEYLNRK